jgi:hypothetical protein
MRALDIFLGYAIPRLMDMFTPKKAMQIFEYFQVLWYLARQHHSQTAMMLLMQNGKMRPFVHRVWQWCKAV